MLPPTKPPWGRLYGTAVLWFIVLESVFLLPLSLGWQEVVGSGVVFAFLAVLGRWLYIHRRAIVHEQQETRLHARYAAGRDVPLGAIQAHYLQVMERFTKQQE